MRGRRCRRLALACSTVLNPGDGCVPLNGVRLGGGENFIRLHDPQLDEGALKRWGGDALNKNTEWNGYKAKGE